MQKILSYKKIQLYILFAIILLGFLLRIYGLNWDQNQHLHPDERFLTMVIQAMQWPASFLTYLNPNISTLNPYNVGYNFYVYGALPLYLNKLVSSFVIINNFEYNNITLVGRFLSALFDTTTLILVFLIAKKIFNQKVALLATFLYATTVLPIQLSHFFAVDTFLVFFLVLTFYLFLIFLNGKHDCLNSSFVGIALGLAFACKISAILIVPTLILGFIYKLVKHKKLVNLTISGILLTLFGYLSFRLTDPKSFASVNIINPQPNPIFISNLKQLTAFNTPSSMYPPGIQWITTQPLIYPFKNIVFWGLGIPLGIIVTLGTIYWVYTILKQFKRVRFNLIKYLNEISFKDFAILLSSSWISILFIYQGTQFVKSLRYFYPIFPFLILAAASFLFITISYLRVRIKNRSTFQFLCFLIFTTLIIWPFSFITIYSKPHSRISASVWIYKNIPPGSTITCEYWDDCLPLSLGTQNSAIYHTVTLSLFDPDTPQKWQKIKSQLDHVDYMILSSNRLWGSIPKVPDKYPVASAFYDDLLSGKTLPYGEKFIEVAEFTSYPTIPFTNIQIPDQSAEEAFTVYDHPEVIIFKNVSDTNFK